MSRPEVSDQNPSQISTAELNIHSAAANHGFIPHSGIMNTEQTITGLAQAYGMGADIAAGLAVVAILLEGDPVAGTWSIGGPYPSKIVDALGEQPQGISYSHNNYEGDSSVTRVDAYLNNGDAHSLSIDKFEGMDMCYAC